LNDRTTRFRIKIDPQLARCDDERGAITPEANERDDTTNRRISGAAPRATRFRAERENANGLS
jgi:hypothetical protein